MNILLVTPFFTPQTGGVATYLEDLRRFLGQRGHEVLVLRTGEARSIERCTVNHDDRVFELYLRAPWVPEAPLKGLVAFLVYFLPTIWKLARFTTRNNIQIVSLEYPLGFMVYFRVLHLFKRFKMIVGLHGDDVLSLHKLPVYEQAVVLHLIHKADWVLAHSSSLLGQAERIVGSLNRRRSYLPYGIDCERLREQAAEHADRTRIQSVPYILTVAKLFDRKGIDVLLHAVRKVRDALDGHTLVIVGDGPEEAKLKQMASDLGVNDRVTFAGDIPNKEIPSLLKHCRFFVLPSRSEPFGIVLLEAMTFGKAILATRVGGIPEFVQDGVNGVLVPSEDPDALAKQILAFIRQGDNTDRIGKNGLAIVEAAYDYRSIIKRYEALFARIVSGEQEPIVEGVY